jgi:hypothetical protein
MMPPKRRCKKNKDSTHENSMEMTMKDRNTDGIPLLNSEFFL